MNIIYVDTTDKFHKMWYDMTLAVSIKNVDKLGIDTEFTNLEDIYQSKLLLLQFYCDDTSYVLDMLRLDHKLVFENFKHVLECADILKVGHNLIIEWKAMYHHARNVGIEIEMRGMHDTMLCERMIHAGLGMKHDLKAVIARRCNIDLDKEVRKGFAQYNQESIFTKEDIEYAGKDAYYPVAIYQEQMDDIARLDLLRTYYNEMDVIALTGMMEYTGVYVNRPMLEELIPPFSKFVYGSNKAFQDVAINAGVVNEILFTKDGYTAINTNSAPQVKAALNSAGLDVEKTDQKYLQKWELQRRHKKGEDFDYHEVIEDDDIATAITAYKGYAHPLLRALVFFRGAYGILNKSVLGILKNINSTTQRVHPSFNSLGAEATGRYSSSGPNFQNIVNNDKLALVGLGQYSVRKCIEAPQGSKLIITDYAGIELLILAILSGDNDLLRQITVGDIHSYVAKHVLDYHKLTPENKKNQPHKLWRDAAKVTSYPIAYGTTGAHLSDVLNVKLASQNFSINTSQGNALIEKWYALFPKTAKYLQSNAEQALLYGFVTDVWGRRRFWDRTKFTNKWKRLAAGREAQNAPIQSTNATMLKRAAKLVWDRFDKSMARIIMLVHDEMVVEAKDEYVEIACRIIKECMEQAIKETLVSVADQVGLYEGTSVTPQVSERYDK